MVHDKSEFKGHLLVVDDNKVNRLLLGRGLEQQGHRVAFAENGRQALEMLHQSWKNLVNRHSGILLGSERGHLHLRVEKEKAEEFRSRISCGSNNTHSRFHRSPQVTKKGYWVH